MTEVFEPSTVYVTDTLPEFAPTEDDVEIPKNDVDAPLVEGRKDFLGHMGPAIYSHHARERMIQGIRGLPFPMEQKSYFTSVGDLGHAYPLSQRLEYSNDERGAIAKKDGVLQIDSATPGLGVFFNGYGDQHFAPQLASILGEDIGKFLLAKEVITEPMRMLDHADLFQTGWFGEIANSMALTRNGLIQANLYRSSDRLRFWDHIGFTEDVYQTSVDPESGLVIAGLTREARKALRSQIDRTKSVGCPVARESFTASPAQADWLEDHGHLGEASGFFAERPTSADPDRVMISQGPYTAIDDVMWEWGDYVRRYATHAITHGADPEDYRPTEAGEKVLLD